jgi:uncharacterized membrane protein SirB2
VLVGPVTLAAVSLSAQPGTAAGIGGGRRDGSEGGRRGLPKVDRVHRPRGGTASSLKRIKSAAHRRAPQWPAMEWLPPYPALKSTHVALATASIGLFVVRGVGVQTGAAWPLHDLLRRGSMLLDTALLAAGVALWATLGLSLAQAPWLAAKLALIVLYVVLGALALRRARTRRGRAVAFAAALACAAAIVGVALAHHPLGPLAPVPGA